MSQASFSNQSQDSESSSTQPIYGWSNDILNKNVENIKVPKIQDDNRTVRNVLLRFWHYYVTGDKPEGVSRQSIIYSAILCAIKPNSKQKIDYLFPEANYNCDGKKDFFKLGKLPTSESKFEWQYKSKIPNRKVLSQKSTKNISVQINKNFTQYEEKNYLEFINYLKKVFDEWDGTKEFTYDALQLLNLTSVISIMCMKALVKNNTALENTFFKKQIRESCTRIMECHYLAMFAPPCKEFIFEIKRSLDKNNTHSKTMFTIILRRYITELLKSNERNYSIMNLLNFACLLSLSYNGLCVIKLFIKAQKKLNNWSEIKFHELVKFYYTDETEEAWIKIFQLLKEYCYSTRWCRLVDHNYYADLQNEKVAPIIVWLEGILSLDPDFKKFFSSDWGKKLLIQYQFEKDYGILVYTLFHESVDKDFVDRPSYQKLLDCAKKKMSPEACADLDKFLKSKTNLIKLEKCYVRADISIEEKNQLFGKKKN